MSEQSVCGAPVRRQPVELLRPLGTEQGVVPRGARQDRSLARRRELGEQQYVHLPEGTLPSPVDQCTSGIGGAVRAQATPTLTGHGYKEGAAEESAAWGGTLDHIRPFRESRRTQVPVRHGFVSGQGTEHAVEFRDLDLVGV